MAIAKSFIINNKGQDIDLWFLSITMYTIIILVVDTKIVFFTRFFTWCSFVSVFVFSIGIYIVYFFVADMINVFIIYKTALALITSPIFYLNVILLVGMAIMVDTLILILEKELKTPMYLLYKSLIDNDYKNKDQLFDVLVNKVKKKLYK